MYETLKGEIEEYINSLPADLPSEKRKMTKAPRLIDPFMTKQLSLIKKEDIEEAKEDYRNKVTMGHISPPVDVE